LGISCAWTWQRPDIANSDPSTRGTNRLRRTVLIPRGELFLNAERRQLIPFTIVVLVIDILSRTPASRARACYFGSNFKDTPFMQ
jgi:hypothetical protein